MIDNAAQPEPSLSSGVYRSTDEAIHVFEAHTGHAIRTIDLDAADLTLSELVSAVRESRKELDIFHDKWLKPVLEELDRHRETTANEDLASIKLSRLLLHLSAIGQASDMLIQGARPTGKSGYQTLVLSQHLLNLAKTVGAAGRAFSAELPKATHYPKEEAGFYINPPKKP